MDSKQKSDSNAAPRRLFLVHGERRIELTPGRFSIGRSSTCHLALDDATVSRRHAQLIVRADRVSIEDLGSVNGVYLNTVRLNGVEPVKAGDLIQIGSYELFLEGALAEDEVQPSVAPTQNRIDIGPDNRLFRRTAPEHDTTFKAHTLDVVGGVAEKILALGRGEEAEKMLAAGLFSLLAEARSKGASAANVPIMERAAWYSVRLAQETGNGKWVDYAIDLYVTLQRPLPARVVDLLYQALREASSINLTGFRAYLGVLRAKQASLGPSERFLVQRIEGLEQIAALR